MIASETRRRLAHERELTCVAVFFNDSTLVATAKSEWRRRAWALRRRSDFAVRALSYVRRGVDAIPLVAPLDAEHEDGPDCCGVHAVPGARGLLRRLPQDRWGIVTSAPALAQSGLRAARLPQARTLVSYGEVGALAGYLDAAQRLGVDPSACVAFANTPAGVIAAKAAGMTVIAVATAHPPDGLAGADYLVGDLRGIVIVDTEPMVHLRIWDTNAPSDGHAA